MTTERKLQLGTWVGTAVLVTLAIVRWAQVRLADGEVGQYELFPLLGLLAFTLMWTHYVSGAVQNFVGAKEGTLRTFFAVTSWFVLALILLHPGIFMYTLWADGLGFPPTSYLSVYVDTGARIALGLGSLSFIAFLAYELHRRYKNASWWRFVEYANVAAMFAIFFHALSLGGEVASGWFSVIWIIYGVILATVIGYTYYYDFKHKKEKQHV